MDLTIAKPRGLPRLLRWLWRRVWSRGMVWTLVVLVSLIVLYWQFENWRSARELVAAHRRLMEQLGTDDPVSYAPPRIPDEQNFFAIPVIQSWGKPREDMKPFLAYQIPDDLMPENFVSPEIKDSEGLSRMDLQGWIAKRLAAGRPLADGEAPAAEMDRELGDASGILPKLVEGLARPYSCLKPGEREAVDAEGSRSWYPLPSVNGLNKFVQTLGLHMRAAARSGNARKASDTGLVALRFGEAGASHGDFIGGLVGLAMHGIIFSAFNEALACPVWDDASLSRLQAQLAKINDLETMDRGLGNLTLWGYHEGLWIRDDRREIRDLAFLGISPSQRDKLPWSQRFLSFAFAATVKYGPVGWHDANIAFYVNGMLDAVGPKSDTEWLNASTRYQKIHAMLKREQTWWNPRRFIGAYALPSLGNIYGCAAQCLFQRRCIIIGCALERYRIAHGAYPPSLSEVQKELAAFQVNDPARPSEPLGYRLEEKGYLLWSEGQDAKDNGGDPEKDWIWRMRRD